MTPDYEIAIVGGGAAGICAAISAARRGHSVVICEKMPRLGKKILATGNGRCNLSNEKINASFYNPAAREVVQAVFDKFGTDQISQFFRDLGLQLHSDEGRIYPATNQAASVLKVLEMELNRLKVRVELSFECTAISPSKEGVAISSRGRKTLNCLKALICGGGKTYPSFGSNGSLYPIIQGLGHSFVEPVPCAVPLVVKDSLCQILQGQRIAARAQSMIEGREGQAAGGELLFTKYGLSGTCILDISEEISIAINRQNKGQVFVAVDLIPFLSKSQLKKELLQRRERKIVPEDTLIGLLPNKISQAFGGLFVSGDLDAALEALKHRLFKVSATRGWNEAEFTAGGVDVKEVTPSSLESQLQKNLYFAGEILDVNGQRGGYNLAWAWASGFIAGKTG